MSKESLVYSGRSLRLIVPLDVVDVWDRYRQIGSKSSEACGVLIGSCETRSDHCVLESVTTPKRSDWRSRFRFFLKDKDHQRSVDEAFARSQGHCGYLGTWHTHPEDVPAPSGVDEKDWLHCIERNNDRPLFFVIVGIKHIQVFAKNRQGFKKLSLENGDRQ